MRDPANTTGRGRIRVGLAGHGALRWVAADFTPLVEEARRRLDLSPLASAALGRVLTGAALLLRLSQKTPSRLLFDVQGNGPLGRILAEVDSEGNLRGTVQRPRATLPPTREGKLRVGEGVGRGVLRVRREQDNGSWESEVQLVTGEIGDDVAHFLHHSEQRRAAVLLGVMARSHGVAAAGGAIVEALPGAGEDAVRRVEDNVSTLSTVSGLIAETGTVGLERPLLKGLDRRVIERLELRYHCRCNRGQVANHLAALAETDLSALRSPDGTVSAECVFCGERYRFGDDEIENGFRGASSRASRNGEWK